MLLYRLKRWTNVSIKQGRLHRRRAVTAMSVRWVSRDWLIRRAGISGREIDSLLEDLSQAGVLEVSDQPGCSAHAAGGGSSSALRSLLLRAWHHGRSRFHGTFAVLSDLPPFDVQLIRDELHGVLSRGEAARHVLAEWCPARSATSDRQAGR